MLTDDDDPYEGCRHESWECSPGGISSWHSCADGCDFTWANTSWFGQNKQIGLCAICKKGPVEYTTKDSGKREDYPSGMRRDTQEGKARFDLLLVDGIPYGDQFLTRVAELLERGATKYGERNWQLANSDEELSRFRASALRHIMQWASGEEDEDHAAAVVFNLMAYESIKIKLGKG